MVAYTNTPCSLLLYIIGFLVQNYGKQVLSQGRSGVNLRNVKLLCIFSDYFLSSDSSIVHILCSIYRFDMNPC